MIVKVRSWKIGCEPSIMVVSSMAAQVLERCGDLIAHNLRDARGLIKARRAFFARASRSRVAPPAETQDQHPLYPLSGCCVDYFYCNMRLLQYSVCRIRENER